MYHLEKRERRSAEGGHTLRYLVGLTWAVALVFATSTSAGEVSTPLRAMASLFPLHEFAKAVGAERAQVDLLLPPGVEPHTWEPKASDIAKMSAADVLIYLGPALEPQVSDILRGVATADLVVVQVTRDLPILAADEGRDGGAHTQGLDPHIWLDLELSQRIVERIAKVFAERDPQGASVYLENARAYTAKLASLDRQYREGLRTCRRRAFVFGGHAAFSYLARRYGLEQISLYAVSPDSRPTPKQLTEVVDLAKRHDLDVIYFEVLVSGELAKVIAKEVGAKTLVLNPGGNLTRKEWEAGVTFLSLMEANLRNLREGLGCE